MDNGTAPFLSRKGRNVRTDLEAPDRSGGNSVPVVGFWENMELRGRDNRIILVNIYKIIFKISMKKEKYSIYYLGGIPYTVYIHKKGDKEDKEL